MVDGKKSKKPRTDRGRFARKEQVVTETVKLTDLQPGSRFIINNTRYYIVTDTDDGILCMSLVQVKGLWSGGEYRTFDLDTIVEKVV